MCEAAYEKILSMYPEHRDIFAKVKRQATLAPRGMPLPEAVVRVVTGQMLSGAAARTIYERISLAANEERLVGSWMLDRDRLRSCGLSNAKVQTVVDFGSHVGQNPKALEHWRALSLEDLKSEITRFKGLGDWTASIIALFYIGHEDVFPAADGSLQRAAKILTERGIATRRRYKFDPDLVRPYRSYLALSLWDALDNGILR
jgi:DNA-3-methyladenine glycosylase II